MNKETKDKIQSQGLESLGIFYGAYRGEVSSNKDPENVGRLQVKCAHVYGDEIPNLWAWPRGNMAGSGHGTWWIPQPGDPIYVSFLNGDPKEPMWEYGWWLRGKTPGTTDTKMFTFMTPAGHRIDLDDTNNSIDVKHKSGFHVKLFEDGIFLGKDGKNLGKFLDDLLQLLVTTTVPTIYGASPFNNAADYVELKTKILEFLKTS